MGLVIITTMGDFAAGVFDPEAAADVATEPGNLLIAAGYTSLRARYRGQHPDYEAGGWGYWELYGYKPGASRIWGRMRVASSEGGLDEAEWTRYLSGWVYVVDPESGLPQEDGLGMALFDIGTEVLNLGMEDTGPWYELEIYMKTD